MNKIQKLKTFLGLNRWENSLARIGRDYHVKKVVARNYPIDAFQSLRFPEDAHFVFYSNDPKAQLALKNLFPRFEVFNPSGLTLGESDEVLTDKIANSLMQSTSPGVFLKGYPFNANQALLLDRQLRGVNLAIYFYNKDSGSYQSSIKDILEYYEKTGALLKWQLKDTLDQTMLKLGQTLATQAKLN